MAAKNLIQICLGQLNILPPARASWFEFGPSSYINMPYPYFLGGASCPEIFNRFVGRTTDLPPFGCVVLNDAYAYGDGLAIIDRYLLLESTITAGPGDIGDWGFFSKVGPLINGERQISDWSLRTEHINEAVLLARRSDFVYGHWLLETLPRVRLAQRLCSDKAVYIVSHNSPEYQIDMLNALGISGEQLYYLKPGEAVSCGKLFIPSIAHCSQNYVNKFALETYNHLVSLCAGFAESSKDYGRIFVNRASRKYDPRPLLNIEEVQAVAEQSGFTVVDPGSIPWREQIAAFAQARAVIGLSGSGLHNTVYTSPNAHVMVLQPNQSRNFLQTAIAGLVGHKVSYLFGESYSAFDKSSSECGYAIDPHLLSHVIAELGL